ncbi:MAG: hypothetical protein ABI200_02460 [Gaiellales bacterium]
MTFLRRCAFSGRLGCAAALLLVAMLMAAGCGAGAKSHPPLSKRIYIDRFNTVQKDAPKVFANVSDATRDPAAAKPHLAAFDKLIVDLNALQPPPMWRGDHRKMLEALRTMRASIDVLSRAPAGKRAIVAAQLQRYRDAETRYGAAVEHVNATR